MGCGPAGVKPLSSASCYGTAEALPFKQGENEPPYYGGVSEAKILFFSRALNPTHARTARMNGAPKMVASRWPAGGKKSSEATMSA